MAKRTKKTTARNNSETAGSKKAWGLIGWLIGAGVWVLLTVALLSFHPADWPSHSVAQHNDPTANWAGRVGALMAYRTYMMLGPGVWLLVAGSGFFLIAKAASKPVTQPIIRAVGLAIMAVATSAILGLMLPNGIMSLIRPEPGLPEGAGGLLAIFINSELVARFSTLGTMIILIVAFWIGALLAVDQLVLALPRLIGRMLGKVGSIQMPQPALAGRLPSLGGLFGRSQEEQEADTTTSKRRKSRPQIDEPIDEDAGGVGATESFGMEHVSPVGAPELDDEEDEDYEQDEQQQAAVDELDEDDQDDSVADAPGAYVTEKKELDPAALEEKFANFKINFAPQKKSATAPPREIDLSGYQFPGLDLLEEPESSFTVEMEQIVRDQAVSLESALQQYKIEGEVVGIDSGPVITLFEVKLAPGTKVAQLNNIDSDLARSLKAPNIRIVPNMAGKDTVGIEVPNLKKEKVRLKELMTVNADQVAKMKLPMFLGKDASGNPLVADLAAMPHMLIAGTTGSGKSVCMNSIIMSFLFTKRPDELKLVLVDPKMVEMSQFRDIPHLMCPVVTEMAKASAILEWAVTKMDERYELLAEAGVRDIASYNGLGWEELKERFEPGTEAEEARIPKKLPYLVFVIDELADLMMTNKEVEGHIVRIAQKARAVGMHLILATQRPQANVVTGLIKGNMPCRISFKVASRLDSRIVLDQSGAELLLGQGDMLFLSPRTSKLTRSQGTLVDDIEIRRSVKFLKTVSQQSFEPQLVQIKGSGDVDVDQEAVKDPLFDDAVRVVLQSKRGSVSLLQRRLTIGYARASRLIEAMAAAGILGEHKGAQAREVLLTLEEYEILRARMTGEDPASAGSDGEPDDDFDIVQDEQDDDSVPDEIDGEYRQ